MENPTPLDRAISKMGSQQALADALGIRSPSITEWKQRGRVPAERCAAIESVAGIPRHELRPDIFGEPPSRRSEASPGQGDEASAAGVPVQPVGEAA